MFFATIKCEEECMSDCAFPVASLIYFSVTIISMLGLSGEYNKTSMSWVQLKTHEDVQLGFSVANTRPYLCRFMRVRKWKSDCPQSDSSCSTTSKRLHKKVRSPWKSFHIYFQVSELENSTVANIFNQLMASQKKYYTCYPVILVAISSYTC